MPNLWLLLYTKRKLYSNSEVLIGTLVCLPSSLASTFGYSGLRRIIVCLKVFIICICYAYRAALMEKVIKGIKINRIMNSCNISSLSRCLCNNYFKDKDTKCLAFLYSLAKPLIEFYFLIFFFTKQVFCSWHINVIVFVTSVEMWVFDYFCDNQRLLNK